MNAGSAQDQLLAGQRAYYSALAPDYLDQGLDLPGGAELTDALDAFRPAGSVWSSPAESRHLDPPAAPPRQ